MHAMSLQYMVLEFMFDSLEFLGASAYTITNAYDVGGNAECP